MLKLPVLADLPSIGCLCGMGMPYPPLKAPTGLLTGGAATASCSNDDDVLKDLEEIVVGALIARLAEKSLDEKALDAMSGTFDAVSGLRGGQFVWQVSNCSFM